MIKTRQDLRDYIAADRARYSIRWFEPLIFSEAWYTLKYLKCLRKLEYAKNNNSNFLTKIRYLFRYLRWRQLSWKYGIIISPNTCGRGLYISHIMGGGIIVVAYARLGDNCIIGPNCIIGTKRSAKDVPVIGNNVEI